MSSKKKKVAIQDRELVYGLGATGLSIARYLKRNDIDAIYYDSREQPPGLDELRAIDPQAEVVVGENPQGLIENATRIIVSPGIPDSDTLIKKARQEDLTVASDIELFMEAVRSPVTAVTGSNGKSTVATLLALMFDAAGCSVLAGGNLGKAALDLLAEPQPDVYVLELSSFQLQRLPNLPVKVAALLNISPDHLDWHRDEQEYRAAKYRIFREAQAVVFNRADENVSQHIPEDIPRLSFGLDAPADGQYGIRNDNGVEFLACGEKLLLSTDDIALVGKHNQANALAALAIGDLMGIELPAMLQVLNEFPGLPHRMQLVGEIAGSKYINDSKATNVGAAIASIESIDGFVVLIAGGVGKGGDFDLFARTVGTRLRCAVLLGADAGQIAEAFEGLAPTERVEDMQQAVGVAANQAKHGDTILLAPACASFDQYQNYQERGDDFAKAVGGLRT